MIKRIVAVLVTLGLMLGGSVAADEGTVKPGDTIEITVVLTADADGTNAIGFSGTAPEGWVVSGGNGDFTKLEGNKVETIWLSEISEGESLTATFQVTIPEGTEDGEYSLDSYFEYYVGSGGPLIAVKDSSITVKSDVADTINVPETEAAEAEVETVEVIDVSEVVASDSDESSSRSDWERDWIESHGGVVGVVSELEAAQIEKEWKG